MNIDLSDVDLNALDLGEVSVHDVMDALRGIKELIERISNGAGIIPAVMNEKEAAAYIGCSVSWLRNGRRASTRPPFLKIGGSIRYRRESLDQWLVQQEVRN